MGRNTQGPSGGGVRGAGRMPMLTIEAVVQSVLLFERRGEPHDLGFV